MIARLFCRILGHVWRRPHKGESPGSSYCRRCPATRTVKKRKAKEVA